MAVSVLLACERPHMEPPPDMLVTTPGPMLCPLGPIWTHTGPILGPSWAHHGLLGLILDPHGPIWERGRESERESERERELWVLVGPSLGPKRAPSGGPIRYHVCIYIYICIFLCVYIYIYNK